MTYSAPMPTPITARIAMSHGIEGAKADASAMTPKIAKLN